MAEMTLEQVRDYLEKRKAHAVSVLDPTDAELNRRSIDAIDAAIKQRDQGANNPLKGGIFDKLAEALRDATYVAGMLDAICETDGTVDHMQARDAAFRVRAALQAHAAEAAQAMTPRELAKRLERGEKWKLVAETTQLQAQSVPGELAEPIEGAFNYEQKLAFTEGWNACREAMLAAAPQQAAEPVAVIESAEDRHGPYLTHANVVLRVWNGYVPKAGDEIYTHPQPAQDAKLPSDEDFRLHLGELTSAELRIARAAFRFAMAKESGRWLTQ